ncbi:MAG: TrmH family RNA methyltransferase [Sphaerochaetaceae bacterium]|jgi:TrmH family RNA methyltransferase|nr:TrmH family RNA methyltransferase [Sphaerochaetaceae bacterium]
MITIRKLASLAEGTKLRKCARILDSAVLSLREGNTYNIDYLKEVCRLIYETPDTRITEATRRQCQQIEQESAPRMLLWALADAVHMVHTDLGFVKADWDFTYNNRLDPTVREVFPFTVVLDRLRSPFNVGSVFRTADSFGVDQILLVHPTASVTHPRAIRSARGCTETIPWQQKSQEEIITALEGESVFALELGGTTLNEFRFPTKGAVIIGSEELGVSPKMLARADASLGRVSIPLVGTKGSLNVSVAFGILMHAWHAQVSKGIRELS